MLKQRFTARFGPAARFVSRSVSRSVFFAPLCLAAVSSVSFAQEDVVQRGERVEITGSNIRRTDTETSSPMQILTREDIERTGKSTIGDVLRNLTGDSQGTLPTAFSAGFATGASGVSLRGLGLNATLVLVNGRRMAPYGLADDGARTFVNLNTIPLEAVERVEVLMDGASAVYGSDAIGGVINVILRDEYRGASLGTNLGTSYKGDGDLKRVTGIFGYGDIDKDHYNAFLSLEASTQGQIKATDRSGFLGTNDLRSMNFFDSRIGGFVKGGGNFADESGPAFSTTNPFGAIRVPGGTQSQRINLTSCPEKNAVTGVCIYDPIGYVQIQPKDDRLNLFSRGTYRLGADTTAYLEGGFFKDRVEATGVPSGVSDGGVFNPANPANPLIVHTARLPANHPDNPVGIASNLSLLTTDLGGRNLNTDSVVKRVVGGIKGSFEKFDYDVGLGYISSDLKQSLFGNVRFSVLQADLNNGTYRINNPAATPQSVRDAISPTLQFESQAYVKLADAHISRPIFDLPGGPLAVAVGTEYRKEWTNRPVTPFTDVSDIVGLGFSAYSQTRNVRAYFGEIDAPIFKWLEAQAAYRFDDYSDVGHSTTPKFGLKIKPIDQVALRASYAEAFRAPGPTESGNSSSLGFTNIAVISIGNPTVKPEKAKEYNFGLVLAPTTNTSASIDYYRVDRTNEIVQADQATILGNTTLLGSPALANAVVPGAAPNSFIFYNTLGSVAAVSGPFENANKTKAEGFEYNIQQRLPLGAYGRLTASANWTHVISFKRTLANGSSFEYAGTQGPFVLSSAAGTPKDRGSLSLTWDRGPWAVTTQVNYVGPMDGIDHKGETLIDQGDGTFATTTGEGIFATDGTQVCGTFYPNGGPAPGGCRIRSFTTVDLFVKYTGLKGWDLSASVQNLFNLKPPFDPYTYGATNYNPAFHQAGAVGAFFTLGAKYAFQ